MIIPFSIITPPTPLILRGGRISSSLHFRGKIPENISNPEIVI